MLHTLSVSPWHVDIDAMLRLVKPGDDLFLLSDGVVAAIDGGRFLEILQSAPITPTCSARRYRSPRAGWSNCGQCRQGWLY